MFASKVNSFVSRTHIVGGAATNREELGVSSSLLMLSWKCVGKCTAVAVIDGTHHDRFELSITTKLRFL